jgi:predicted phosphodiesterase
MVSNMPLCHPYPKIARLTQVQSIFSKIRCKKDFSVNLSNIMNAATANRQMLVTSQTEGEPMPSFDLISDLHLDFWIKKSWNPFKEKKGLRAYITHILPESASDTLVIAGDIGHHNKQNVKFLKMLKTYYKHILLVPGNHDYYLVSKSIRYTYNYDSMNRLKEMKKLTEELPGVRYLDGEIVTINGINYGGCGMWYDFQYGIQILNSTYAKIFDYWQTVSNDAALTRGLPRLTRDMFYEEKRKLAHILAESDVIITHFSPDWNQAPAERKLDLSTSFYYFDGTPYLQGISKKIWCFGHIHTRMDYVRDGCRFINAAVGYPNADYRQPTSAIQVKITK